MPLRWIVLAGLVTARIAWGFQLPIVTILAPGLMEGLALDVVSIGTLAGLFTLPGLVLAIPGGMLSQKLGERRFIVACLVALTAGGILCGLTESFWLLWLGRLIAGSGAIGINVAMTKVVIDWFANKEINTAMSIFLSGFLVGMALAMVSLGQFATPGNWPWGFFLASTIGFTALVLFLATYKPAPGSEKQLGSLPRLKLSELGLVSIAGLIWALYNAAFIIYVGFFPLYLIDQGHSTEVAASTVGAGIWIAILGVPLGGFIADKINRTNAYIITSVLFYAFAMLLTIPWSHSIPFLLFLFVLANGVGSLCIGSIVALASEGLRPEVRGTGMGVFYTWLYGGIAAGPIMGGYVSDITREPAASIFLFTATLIVALLSLGVFRLLQARHREAFAANRLD